MQIQHLSILQAAKWSRDHLDAAGAAADECEENIDAIVGEYVNGTDYLAACHQKWVSKPELCEIPKLIFKNGKLIFIWVIFYPLSTLSRSIGKCFMGVKMALCTELITEEADDGDLGVEEYRDIVACAVGMECP